MFIYCLLTERCNLACSHCLRGNKHLLDMDFSDFECIIRQIAQLWPHADIVLTGGEPTLHPQFNDFLALSLSTITGEVIINSNGTTNYYISNLERLRAPRIHIQFSLDGSPQAHDKIRGGEVFAKVKHNMDLLSNSSIKLWISTVVTPFNLTSMDELRDILVQYKIEKWHVNPVLPFGCGKNKETLGVSEWNLFVDHLINTTPLRLGIKKLYDFSVLKKLSQDSINKIKNTIARCHLCNCGSGNNKIYIYPDLTVYGCTCLTDFPFGNLRDNCLANILATSNAHRIKNYLLNTDSPCRKCSYVEFCNGGCIGMSFHSFGEIGIGDARCPHFKELQD